MTPRLHPLVFLAFAIACLFSTSACLNAKSPDDTPASDEIVYNLKDVDVKPVVRGTRATPVYPLEMRKKRIGGTVMIELTIDKKGIPKNVKIIRSTHREFEKPSIEAVKKWRFRAAKKDGKPVPCRTQFPISFTPAPEQLKPRQQ